MNVLIHILFAIIIFSINLTHSFADQRVPVYIDKNNSEKIVLPAGFDAKIIGFPYIMDHDKKIINFGDVLQWMLVNDLKRKGIYISSKGVEHKYVLIIEIVGYNFGNDVHVLNHIMQPYFSLGGEVHEITSFSEISVQISIYKPNRNTKSIVEKRLIMMPIKVRVENTQLRDDTKLTEHLSMGPYVKPATLEWEKLCYKLSSEILYTLEIFLDHVRD